MSSLNFTGTNKKLLNYRQGDANFLQLFNSNVEGRREIKLTNYIDLETINVKKEININQNSILDSSGISIYQGKTFIDTSKMYDLNGLDINDVKNGKSIPESNLIAFSKFQNITNNDTPGIYFNKIDNNKINTIALGKSTTEKEGGIGRNQSLILDVSGHSRFDNGTVDFKDNVNIRNLNLTLANKPTSNRILVIDDNDKVGYIDKSDLSSNTSGDSNLDTTKSYVFTGNNNFEPNHGQTVFKGTVDFTQANVNFNSSTVNGINGETSNLNPIVKQPTASNNFNDNIKVFDNKINSNIALNSGNYAQMSNENGDIFDVSLNQGDTLNEAFLKSQYWTNFFFLSQPPKYNIININREGTFVEFTFIPHKQKTFIVGKNKVMKPEISYLKSFLIDITDYLKYNNVSSIIQNNLSLDKGLNNQDINTLFKWEYNPHLYDVYDRNSVYTNGDYKKNFRDATKNSYWKSINNKDSLLIKINKNVISEDYDLSLNIIDIIHFDNEMKDLNNDEIKLISNDSSGSIINQNVTAKLYIRDNFKTLEEPRDRLYGGTIGYKHVFDNQNIVNSRTYCLFLIPSNGNILNHGRIVSKYNPSVFVIKTKDIGPPSWNNYYGYFKIDGSNNHLYIYFDNIQKHFKLYRNYPPLFNEDNDIGRVVSVIYSNGKLLINDQISKIYPNELKTGYSHKTDFTIVDFNNDLITIQNNNGQQFEVSNPGFNSPFITYTYHESSHIWTSDNRLDNHYINITNIDNSDINPQHLIYFKKKQSIIGHTQT